MVRPVLRNAGINAGKVEVSLPTPERSPVD
jgi:hypothetical protein